MALFWKNASFVSDEKWTPTVIKEPHREPGQIQKEARITRSVLYQTRENPCSSLDHIYLHLRVLLKIAQVIWEKNRISSFCLLWRTALQQVSWFLPRASQFCKRGAKSWKLGLARKGWLWKLSKSQRDAQLQGCTDSFSRWRQCIHLFLLSNGRLNSHRKTLFSCPPPNMERGGSAQYGLAGRHNSDLRFENPQFSTRGIVCCFIQRAWREASNHHHSSHNDISMRFPSTNMNNWTWSWFRVLSACTGFILCVKSTGTL